MTLIKASFENCAAIYYLTNQFGDNLEERDKKALFTSQFLINNDIKGSIFMQMSLTEQDSYTLEYAEEIDGQLE